ncbi:hypothetical protein SCHPADRAFT_748754 [Schizopora paradoxa]|uniref:Uncharacterized protein n=1 Tax=Schizopora paradoxa TaxID=27342 RepID=A0A0H2QZ42_9AGAM|nr:hypothetical protein SCHPADRAFT_748754 [Schizopora paradoxa]
MQQASGSLPSRRSRGSASGVVCVSTRSTSTFPPSFPIFRIFSRFLALFQRAFALFGRLRKLGTFRAAAHGPQNFCIKRGRISTCLFSFQSAVFPFLSHSSPRRPPRSPYLPRRRHLFTRSCP